MCYFLPVEKRKRQKMFFSHTARGDWIKSFAVINLCGFSTDKKILYILFEFYPTVGLI